MHIVQKMHGKPASDPELSFSPLLVLEGHKKKERCLQQEFIDEMNGLLIES